MSTATTVTRNRLRHRRRLSNVDTHDVSPLLEALDFTSSGSARQSLGALRILLLSYLEDVENRLSTIESPISEIGIPAALKLKGEHTVEDARVWARDALEMLRSIRSDVCSHLPELPDVPSLSNVRAQLSHSLADTTSVMEDVRSCLSDKHISAISARLQSLQAHLRSLDMLTTDLHTFPGSTRLSGLFESIRSSELIAELSDDVTEAEDMARDIACAIKQSLQGSKLIRYVDLPPQWRNNRFVTRGYRYVLAHARSLMFSSCPLRQVHSTREVAAYHYVHVCMAQRNTCAPPLCRHRIPLIHVQSISILISFHSYYG